jgi:hypothetical protein
MSVVLPNKPEKSRTPAEKQVQVPVGFRPALHQLLQERDGQLPIWVRAPVRGNEYFSGMSRPKLYELARSGVIRSASLRQPGQIKGVRLFHLRSILDYIERHASGGGEICTTAPSPHDTNPLQSIPNSTSNEDGCEREV